MTRLILDKNNKIDAKQICHVAFAWQGLLSDAFLKSHVEMVFSNIPTTSTLIFYPFVLIHLKSGSTAKGLSKARAHNGNEGREREKLIGLQDCLDTS